MNTATALVNCPRCNGTGIYTGFGTCFRCGGSGRCRPMRERPAPTPPAYVSIESACIDWKSPHELLAKAKPQTIDYYGGRARFEALAEAWDMGYREVRNASRQDIADLPLYR